MIQASNIYPNKKFIAFTAALTALASCICIFLIDSYFIFNRKWGCELCQFDAELGWSIMRNKKVSNGKVAYTTNSLGFRSKEVDLSKKHILVLGDSVAFGVGVNNDQTTSYYLEQKLKGHQVLTLAAPGYGIDQYYLNLQKNISKTNSKVIVVVIYTGNDLDDTRKDSSYGMSKPFFAFENGELKNINPKLSRLSCQNFLTGSRIIKFIIPNQIKNQFCKSRVFNQNQASSQIAALLEKIERLSATHYSKVLFVLSPSLIAVKSVQCELKNSPDKCSQFDKGFQLYYLYFRKLLELKKYPYIDHLQNLIWVGEKTELAPLFNDNGKDIHHYSPSGNEILAKSIYEHIKKL